MWIIAVIVLVLIDQGTKFLVANTMEVGDTITLIPGVFNIRYVVNEGAAFGMFEGGRIIFVIAGIAMIAFMIYLIRRDKKLGHTIIPEILIIGGGIGNIIDRVFLAGVRDFLDVPFFAVMNLADWFVSVGIGLLIVKYIYYWRKGEQKKKETEEAIDGK